MKNRTQSSPSDLSAVETILARVEAARNLRSVVGSERMSELIDRLTNAKKSDLSDIDSEIAEQEEYIAKLRRIRKTLAKIIGNDAGKPVAAGKTAAAQGISDATAKLIDAAVAALRKQEPRTIQDLAQACGVASGGPFAMSIVRTGRISKGPDGKYRLSEKENPYSVWRDNQNGSGVAVWVKGFANKSDAETECARLNKISELNHYIFEPGK